MEILDQPCIGNTGQLKIIAPLDITNAEKADWFLVLKRLMYTRYFNISVYDDRSSAIWKDPRKSFEKEYPFLC
ncbi:MAG: hypothetical protein IPJ13_00390 [Saprospiraceae bacterium]|nr:hypothetical protein [Saprospiraceae bacterium]